MFVEILFQRLSWLNKKDAVPCTFNYAFLRSVCDAAAVQEAARAALKDVPLLGPSKAVPDEATVDQSR
jgi:hypothetical protein